MHLKEYIQFDGLGLAALVRQREVSAGELVQLALKAIEQTNPRLNAVIATLEDGAQAALKQGLPEGPFTGVPFLIKTFCCTRPECPRRWAAGGCGS